MVRKTGKHTRSAAASERRSLRRSSVTLERNNRMCSCPPWGPHEASCPLSLLATAGGVEPAQPKCLPKKRQLPEPVEEKQAVEEASVEGQQQMQPVRQVLLPQPVLAAKAKAEAGGQKHSWMRS